MGLFIVVSVLIVVSVVGYFYGADSRDGRDWQCYRWTRDNQAGNVPVPVRSGGTVEGTWAGCTR
jgi:hypothetical protein